MGLEVKVRLHEGGSMPERHGEWYDLSTAHDVMMKPLEFRLISLGVSMQLPEGYYAVMAPRSSTARKWGIIQGNSIGVIENAYCGDNDVWQFPAVAIRSTFIPAGTRICQFRLVKQEEPVEFQPVEHLYAQDRGGIGSTGD